MPTGKRELGATKVCVITTGGTIAKTYNESDGSLLADGPVIEKIVASLRLPDVTVKYQHVLSKDSLDLTEEDRATILSAVQLAAPQVNAVIVVHGTDTLAQTGELLTDRLGDLTIPVVLTGAMRPYEFRDTDAAQNVTEALLACRLIPPGVYVAMHNRVLKFPGVVKHRESLSFVKPQM